MEAPIFLYYFLVYFELKIYCLVISCIIRCRERADFIHELTNFVGSLTKCCIVFHNRKIIGIFSSVIKVRYRRHTGWSDVARAHVNTVYRGGVWAVGSQTAHAHKYGEDVL